MGVNATVETMIAINCNQVQTSASALAADDLVHAPHPSRGFDPLHRYNPCKHCVIDVFTRYKRGYRPSAEPLQIDAGELGSIAEDGADDDQ